MPARSWTVAAVSLLTLFAGTFAAAQPRCRPTTVTYDRNVAADPPEALRKLPQRRDGPGASST